MTWFKVDDSLTRSRKVLSIPRSRRLSAMGLWALAGSWSAGEGLDGFVPAYMVEELGGDDEVAGMLVSAGLWKAATDGFRFHDWADYNPDAASSRAARNAKSEGGERGNHLRWHVGRRIVVAGCQWCGTPSLSHTDRISDGASESVPNPPDPYPTHKNISSESADALPRPDVDGLLDLLDAELTRNGVTKLPKRSKAAHDAARLLLDRDGRTVDQVERAIRWAQGDPFWRSVVMSMPKLREQYEQLQLAAKRTPRTTSTRPEVTTQDEWMYR